MEFFDKNARKLLIIKKKSSSTLCISHYEKCGIFMLHCDKCLILNKKIFHTSKLKCGRNLRFGRVPPPRGGGSAKRGIALLVSTHFANDGNAHHYGALPCGHYASAPVWCMGPELAASAPMWCIGGVGAHQCGA